MAEGFALTEATYYILLSLVRPRHGYGIMHCPVDGSTWQLARCTAR